MGFLGALADQMAENFSAGENKRLTLDSIEDGKNIPYGTLGDFAKKFDQSAERKYVEQGYIIQDPFNIDTNQFEILMQQPSATILIKKQMFSSLGENFNPAYMDDEEKIYLKAVKTLLNNKCSQIASLEKLSKLQKIAAATGSVDDQMMSLIMGIADTGFLDFFKDAGAVTDSNQEVGKFARIMDQLRKIYIYNKPSYTTKWITDTTAIFKPRMGEGTGVIEITNFTNFTTSTTVDTVYGSGDFTISIDDPYEMMVVTEYDIEKAISDTVNMFNNSSFMEFGKQSANELINNLTSDLNLYRSARKASPISIKINPQAIIGRRVTAVIDRIGVSIPFTYDTTSALTGGLAGNGVDVPEEYLENGEIAGFDGLSGKRTNVPPGSMVKRVASKSELSIFKELITAIYNKIALDANTRNVLVTSNINSNYARKKLRFNFLGKTIIQPMDVVNFYINSRSAFDNKILAGLKSMFTGLNVLQNIGNQLAAITEKFNTIFRPSDIANQIEKSTFVGADFPNLLWTLVKPQFTNEKEGTHVFGGIVESSSYYYRNGKYSVSIRGSDNLKYLQMGKVNFTPAPDIWNGDMFDPLTPFQSKFGEVNNNYENQIPVLLPENQVLLSSKKSSVKFKAGPNAGTPVTGANFIQDASVGKDNRIRKMFYAPDGLVYKWKEGIGVYVRDGNSITINNPSNTGFQSTFQDPLARLDVMNVISLLITGEPYNFYTYLNTVKYVGDVNKDSKIDTQSYYGSLSGSLKKRNALWGNFIPFKNITLDQEAITKKQKVLTDFVNKNTILTGKLQELENLELRANINGMHAFNDAGAYDENSAAAQAIAKVATDLSSEIDNIISEMDSYDKNNFTQIGDEIQFDFDDFMNDSYNDDKSTLGNSDTVKDAAVRRFIRRKLNYLTRRMSYNIRANKDKNLFIVDDFYDKDYDLAAFVSGFNSNEGEKWTSASSEFTSVKEKVVDAAKILNLELFCDSQGHIRVRPPQYNRVPSSVFYKMMQQKKALGIQVFPDFLDKIFKNQLDTLKIGIEAVEDQIRLDCAFLGQVDDDAAAFFILEQTLFGGANFSFLSYEDSGFIPLIDELLDQANPDSKDKNVFLRIERQTKIRNLFTTADKFRFIKQTIQNTSKTADTSKFNLLTTYDSDLSERISKLIRRITDKTGQKPNIEKDFFKISGGAYGQAPQKFIDIFKITNSLASKLALRQKYIKLFYNSLKTSQEYRSLDGENAEETSNRLLIFGAHGNKNTPSVYEHMIEDESYDDYGPGSGKRYVIKNSQIISYDFSENPPENTMVEVKGVNDGALNFENTEDSNRQTVATAVDFDLWRMYGFKSGTQIQVPFLSDPQTQCAPYATSMLSLARKDILKGRIDITGNEYMQPGDVVYIECKGLLFYVTSVTHSYYEGRSFSTSLELKYGHSPGEYIPTTLDVIGKALYNNRDISDIQIHRQSNSFSEANYGVLILDPKTQTSLEKKLAYQEYSEYTDSNLNTLNDMIFATQYLITNNDSKGNNVKSKIQLRIYYDNENQYDPSLESFANDIKKIMTTPSDKVKSPLPSEIIEIVFCDLSDQSKSYSPSQKAWDICRTMSQTHSTRLREILAKQKKSIVLTESEVIEKLNLLKSVMFNYIVDIFVKLEVLPKYESQ